MSADNYIYVRPHPAGGYTATIVEYGIHIDPAVNDALSEVDKQRRHDVGLFPPLINREAQNGERT